MSSPETPATSSVAPRESLDITIEPALESDVSTIAAIGAKTFVETFCADMPQEDIDSYLADNYTPKALTASLKDKDCSTWVARVAGGRVVGFIEMVRGKKFQDVRCVFDNSTSFQGLNVESASRGKGIGTKLVAFVEERARREGFERLLITVWEHNTKALGMYERRGYRKTGDTVKFVMGKTEQTDWVFKKDL